MTFGFLPLTSQTTMSAEYTFLDYSLLNDADFVCVATRRVVKAGSEMASTASVRIVRTSIQWSDVYASLPEIGITSPHDSDCDAAAVAVFAALLLCGHFRSP